MLRKDAETSWTEDCQKAFDKIKEYMSTLPVLVPPEPRRPFLLYLSVLDGAFRCDLGQHDETGRKDQAIYYLSKKFTPYEARYSLLERTSCALTWTTQKLRHYFYAYTTYLISRMDRLKYIFQKPMPPGKLAKWQILLTEFDIIYVTQKAVKGQALVDHLAENPKLSFIEEDIAEAYDGWRMFFDGTANFKGVGIEEVLVSETDALATLSSMIQHPDKNFINPIPARIHNQPAYCAHVEEEMNGKPWFHYIKEYLAKGEYPEHTNHTQKHTLRRLSNYFFQSGGTLYRRTPDLGLLRCVDTNEASRLLEVIHAGTCGPYEWFCSSQKDTQSWIFMDDHGNRLHQVRPEMPPMLGTCRHDRGTIE
ncbi:uncharacterized protein [Nicotiana sylvestris]|uniref:uncharacterized protein n=1 Tax=Nicotiana sylvestris TaxID=4096 RepID=UPI00388C845A